MIASSNAKPASSAPTLDLIEATIYKSMQRAHLWEVRRYRRFVTFLACHELNKGPEGSRHRTQDAVCRRAGEIHRRHFPLDANVSFNPRTLRDDDLCKRLCHRLRGYKTASKKSSKEYGTGSGRMVSQYVHRMEIERRKRAEGSVRELRAELAVKSALLAMAERQGIAIDPSKVPQN